MVIFVTFPADHLFVIICEHTLNKKSLHHPTGTTSLEITGLKYLTVDLKQRKVSMVLMTTFFLV